LYEAVVANNMSSLMAEQWFGEEQLNWSHPKEGHKTALVMAATRGNLAVLRFLLDQHGLDVNKPEGSSRTALHAAIEGGFDDCVSLLLAHPRIDVNKSDARKRTPLHCAAAVGFAEAARMLLAQGCSVNTVDSQSFTSLDCAANSEVARILTGAGARTHAQMEALLRMQSHAQVEAQAQAQAQAQSQARAMLSPPLQVLTGTTDSEEFLLLVGLADPYDAPQPPPPLPPSPPPQQPAPQPFAEPKVLAPKGIGYQFYNAATKGDLKKLQTLVDKWGDTCVPGGSSIINWPNPDFQNWTPLIGAAANGKLECVRFIASQPGVDLNATNLDGETALLWGVRVGDAKVVTLLKEAGADVNKPTKNGRTAKEYAKTAELKSCLEIC
jgi:hypothetical protein